MKKEHLAGRVIASEGEVHTIGRGLKRHQAIVPGAEPGDFVEFTAEGDGRVLVHNGLRDYPGPKSEVARLPRRRMEGLWGRSAVVRGLHEFFSRRGFLYIEPPTLVPAPGMEVNIKALQAEDGYLITSPEFSMKRLLSGGLEQIYAVCRCFRADESGKQHQREFTMVEWYRSFDTLETIEEDTENLVSSLATSMRGAAEVVVAGRTISVAPPWIRMSVSEACERWIGVKVAGDETTGELRRRFEGAGVDCGNATCWDELFSVAFVDKIEPGLAAMEHAVFLRDWPLPLAALARQKEASPVALRSEAYIGGVELANGFDELCDAKEQRRRFEAEQRERKERGLKVYPIDERFMAALEEGLPPAAGTALGLDRLAMLMVGAEDIRDVSAFTQEEL